MTVEEHTIESGDGPESGVCQECGATGQTGVFCESCGAVLRSRALQARPPGTAPAVSSSPSPSADAVGPGPSAEPAEPAEPADPGEDADTLASTPTMVPPPADQAEVQAGVQAERERRARELIVPLVGRAPGENPIAPVPPGRPEPARPAVRTTHAAEIGGGLACPYCGTANPPERHFCRRCAMSLAAAPAPAIPRPWWRRLLDRFRTRVPYAGQRPRLRRGMARPMRWGVGVAIVVVLAIVVDANAGTALTNVEDHFLTPVEVTATDWSVPDSLPQYPYTNLYDTYNNTWWGSNRAGESAGTTLTARFAEPIDLLDLIITPGAGADPTTFDTESRPRIIHVTLVKADGTTSQATLTFNDAVGPETFAVRGNDVSSIVFTIDSAYLGSGPANSTYLAITEIEFFARSAQRS